MALDADSLSALPTRVEPGETVPTEAPARIDRYIVHTKLGRGASGDVYAAYDPELDRNVAVKLLRERPGAGDEQRTRLFREAQTMARLTHPNVVTVFDVGVSDGRVFMAMELVDGTTLRAWQRGDRSLWERVRVYAEAGRGLAAAHAAGIVHRDFKPDNVLIDRNGAVKVTDFGIARGRSGTTIPAPPATPSTGDLLDSRKSLVGAALTREGAIVGTPGYMAPEQYRAGETDHRTDQFAFCAALYEAIYGERPFEGETFDEIRKSVLLGSVRPAKRGAPVPARIRKVLLRGLSRDPDARYPSMETLLAKLRWERGHKARVVAGVAGLAVVATSTAFGAHRALAAREAALCSGGVALAAEVWNAAARSAVESAFAKSRLPYSAEAFAKTKQGLDAYATSWADAHRAACEATRLHGTQTEAAMQLRMTCLDQRRRQLGTFVRHLVTADDASLSVAAQAAYALPDLRSCADVTALTSVEPKPVAPEPRAEADAITRELDEIRVVAPLGRVDLLVPRLRALRDRARALGYAPLEADVAMQLGSLLRVAGDPSALEIWKEAVLAAERGRAEDIKVAAEASIAHILANRHKFEEASYWLALGRATASHADRKLEAQLFRVEGWLEYERDNFGEADRAFQRALPLYARDYPLSAEYALLLSGAASVAMMAGHEERALELGRDADAISVALFGKRSPVRAGVLSNRAATLLEAARYDEALAVADDAITLANEAGLPATQNRRMMAHYNRIEALLGLGRLAEAEAELATEKTELDRAATDTERDDYGRKWTRLQAKVFVLTGRAERALSALASLEPSERNAEVVEEDAVLLLLRGEAELRTAKPRAAAEHLRRALDVMGRSKYPTPARLEEASVAHLLLAEALEATGSDGVLVDAALAAVEAGRLPRARRPALDALRARRDKLP